jgi:alkanesulfonate monooxygenase SsuD/methylene tetrahydromethanopterin reductase-like flavin-dependent oxidoreductase (luciferase family)
VPAPLRLGFLTHLHGSADPRRVYRDYVELFVAAEELGFDPGWVAQHHFDPAAGGLPSPFPFWPRRPDAPAGSGSAGPS